MAQTMTLDDIANSIINSDVAREAHAQVSRRLEDALMTKTAHEQKAFALLAAYITIALAAFAVAGWAANQDTQRTLFGPFFFIGVIYTIAAGGSGCALLPRDYGTLGSDPSVWLRHGVINGDAKALAATFAYETYFHYERIAASAAANRSKALLIRVCILVGVIAPAVLCVWLWATTN